MGSIRWYSVWLSIPDRSICMSDYVRIYRERFWTLWTVLKNIFYFVFPKGIEHCNGSCEQGKVPCDCGEYGGPRKKSGNSKSL